LARAKRTDRTNARRRYRAQLAGEPDGFEDDDELVDPTASASSAPAGRKGAASSSSRTGGASSTARGAGSSPPRPVRPSFTGSIRLAYHPAKIREDLPYLPRLLTHWSVLVSAAVALVGTVLYIPAVMDAGTQAAGAVPATTDVGWAGYLGGTVFQLFVSPPPFGAALLMGFMLPRATYLVGLVYGAFTSLLVTVYAVAVGSRLGFGDAVLAYIVQAWVLGLLGTMFFTAGIAWYRRFLDLLNPNRGQRAKQAQKPQQGRGNAPRNRLSGPNH
jgi:hypothetical protein